MWFGSGGVRSLGFTGAGVTYYLSPKMPRVYLSAAPGLSYEGHAARLGWTAAVGAEVIAHGAIECATIRSTGAHGAARNGVDLALVWKAY